MWSMTHSGPHPTGIIIIQPGTIGGTMIIMAGIIIPGRITDGVDIIHLTARDIITPTGRIVILIIPTGPVIIHRIPISGDHSRTEMHCGVPNSRFPRTK